jgi:hypothetical protein
MGIEPVILLIFASSGGWFVMALYSTMLIVLDRRALPDEIRLKGWRLPIIVITAVFFIALSLFLLYQTISAPGSLWPKAQVQVQTGRRGRGRWDIPTAPRLWA